MLTCNPIMVSANAIVLDLISLVNIAAGNTMCSVVWSSSVTHCVSDNSFSSWLIAHYRWNVRKCDRWRNWYRTYLANYSSYRGKDCVYPPTFVGEEVEFVIKNICIYFFAKKRPPSSNFAWRKYVLFFLLPSRSVGDVVCTVGKYLV